MKDKIKNLLLQDGHNGIIAGIDQWGIFLQITDDEDELALGYFTCDDRIYAISHPTWVNIDVKCPLEKYDGEATLQEADYPVTYVTINDVNEGYDITDYAGKLEVAYDAIVDLLK